MRDGHGLEIGLVVVLAVAAVGLVSGVESSGQSVASYVEDRHARAPAGIARSYRDMQVHATGPNAALPDVWWQTISTPADLFVVAHSGETSADRSAALARRAERRAFDGAPPTIPHAVEQLGTPACLTCHDRGVKVAELVAPRMSHARHDSCLQCHIVTRDPRPGTTTTHTPATTFVAAAVPRAIERAWQGVPPTIPHSILMRERCDSCHGSRGVLGLRGPHPWQQACMQCHVPSAVLDQRAPVAFGRAP